MEQTRANCSTASESRSTGSNRSRARLRCSHLVILSRGKAAEALEWARGVLERLGLILSEQKTSIRDARQERFDFLGYSFGPHFSKRTGREYLGYSPSKKRVKRIREKVAEHLKPSNVASWEEVRDRLNQKLKGWKAYFDEHVEEACTAFSETAALLTSGVGIWGGRSASVPSPNLDSTAGPSTA